MKFIVEIDESEFMDDDITGEKIAAEINECIDSLGVSSTVKIMEETKQ